MSRQLYPALTPVAQRIEARAKANAAAHVDTGDYRRSIHTERQLGRERVRVRVIADDEVSAILEARYHIIARAVG